MNKKCLRKLTLHSETLHRLDGPQLLKIGGGIEISQFCPETYTQPTNLCPEHPGTWYTYYTDRFSLGYYAGCC